jgi:phospholipid/cholesterol/gamma-HCH transport system substrate-binding protein
MRRLTLAFCILVVVFVALLFPFGHHASHKLNIRAYFRSASGLNSGAAVRVDGVNVGSVTSVRIRPELGERPIEVLIAIGTPYDLAIPNDSLVSLTTEGVLGPTIADIDTRQAHGARIADNGVLATKELTPEEAAQATKRVKDAIIRAVDKALPDAPITNSGTKQTDSAK